MSGLLLLDERIVTEPYTHDMHTVVKCCRHNTVFCHHCQGNHVRVLPSYVGRAALPLKSYGKASVREPGTLNHGKEIFLD